MNSCCFCFLGESLHLSFFFWETASPGIVFLADNLFFFQYFKYINLFSTGCKTSAQSLIAVSGSDVLLFCCILFLAFDNVIIMCLWVALLRLNLFGILWVSWFRMSISLSSFVKSSAIIALKILSVPFPFSCF